MTGPLPVGPFLDGLAASGSPSNNSSARPKIRAARSRRSDSSGSSLPAAFRRAMVRAGRCTKAASWPGVKAVFRRALPARSAMRSGGYQVCALWSQSSATPCPCVATVRDDPRSSRAWASRSFIPVAPKETVLARERLTTFAESPSHCGPPFWTTILNPFDDWLFRPL